MTDPFAVLGLPRRFALDMKHAEARHLELSRTLHPDKYAGAGAGERRMALSRAVEVNEAWRMLRDPIKRAEVLLKLSGLEDEVGETREPKSKPDFLMQALEDRERLDDAKTSKDANAIEAIGREARERHAAAIEALARAIDPVLEQGGGRDTLRAAIPLLGKLRYAARFLDEARNAEDEIASASH